MTEHIIYKYTLQGIEGQTIIEMPDGAFILHVASVNDVVCVWACVDPDEPIVKRTLALVGTGSLYSPSGLYVGSAITLNGRVVWHVFDLGVV